MYIGVDYYPEHWPETRWPLDAKLMKEAGFNIVRLAEFAWVNLEPEEGKFEFEWLERAIGLLGQEGISVILGTPTAAMPVWVARKYPESLALRMNGQREPYGVRKHNCYSFPKYRELSKRITSAMAERFSPNPYVIGWQTDNEFGAHVVCHCEYCKEHFRKWLRERYGTIDRLNSAWGLHFWGQRVSSWDEIDPPHEDWLFNPSLQLDWKRHFTHLQVSFQHEQVEILRKTCPSHFITHNCMGLFKDIDYYELGKDLDFISWDNYPLTNEDPTIRYDASFAADVMRGIKKKNFWIMEQTAGPAGWGEFRRNPRPGELRNIAYQQIAHGADAILWFRWRTCTAGREQYWHGLLGHDGRPLRRYQEAAQTAKELSRLWPFLENTTVKTRVALLYDYQSLWAFDFQKAYEGCNPQKVMSSYYNAFFRQAMAVDVISPEEDFSSYSLILAPHLYIMPDHLAEKLEGFVREGGVLLADARTGVKNETSLCHERTLPGKLSDCLGISIEEYDVTANPVLMKGIGNLSGAYHAEKYLDWIRPAGAEVCAQYEGWFLEDYAAVTRNRFGKGYAWYVGTEVKEPVFYDKLCRFLLQDASLEPQISVPHGVEACIRTGEGREILFLMNQSELVVEVNLPDGVWNPLIGGNSNECVRLDRHGVAVFMKNKK
jgi:beta-galactosidase